MRHASHDLQGTSCAKAHEEDQCAASTKLFRHGKTVREVASAAGISERHLRRLVRQAKSGGGSRRDQDAARLTTHLLGALGHSELLGTSAHAYLAGFIAEFVDLLSVHIIEDEAALDRRWAKGNARQTLEKVREAARRRQESLDQVI